MLVNNKNSGRILGIGATSAEAKNGVGTTNNQTAFNPILDSGASGSTLPNTPAGCTFESGIKGFGGIQ